jgi:hypothetical protein
MPEYWEIGETNLGIMMSYITVERERDQTLIIK